MAAHDAGPRPQGTSGMGQAPGSQPPPQQPQGINSPEVVAFSTIVLNYVIPRVVTELESAGVGPAQAFADSLRKAETEIPGIAYQVVSSILQSQSPQTNILEQFLRLSGDSGGADPYLVSLGGHYADLENHAHQVKLILSSLPQLVLERTRFLDNIKKIASNLKGYLSALIHIIEDLKQKYPHNTQIQRKLQYRRQEFSRASRHFSDQLKVYFQDNSKTQVIYPSALVLIASNCQFSLKLKEALLQLNHHRASNVAA